MSLMIRKPVGKVIHYRRLEDRPRASPLLAVTDDNVSAQASMTRAYWR
ncbi:hypothetical protein ACOJBO_38015 [Rhizobium beringeri]